MKNVALLLFLILFQVNIFAQSNHENTLINAFITYKNTNEFNDSIKFNQNFKQLNAAIENTLINDDILTFKTFKKIADSLSVIYSTKKSENNDFIIFTMADDMFHWNFVLHNNVIIIRNHKWHQYFTEIHNLTTNEILLIEQQNDLTFSCNYAFVYQKRKNVYKLKKAFGNKDKLTVCNFTNIENNETHLSLPVKKILFDYKNKKIMYGTCINAENGEKTLGEASYKKGKFKIKDCDERSGFIEVE